ncbi:hypothetical protein [Paraburkholderia acidisoli]|uniref:Uncharacterized protein n=1 Tax=Paraburkholderia acidisoli TaxID=2571748 RepID=A0A7Z2GP92_9BURK|nr:hypothetical protein [Paraburkholderia acidisoli]QGZ65457.1 hypothetical protein FAZ98_27260 [Paraburkholderia acidisoli]
MKRPSLIALAAYAVVAAAWVTPPVRGYADTPTDSRAAARPDTRFEGHVQPFVAPGAAPVAPPAAVAAAAKASSDAKTRVPAKAAKAASGAHAVLKRRGAPRTPAVSTARARASAPDDAPFAFRGIPLGTTLAALRDTSMVRATPHESELLCETDIAGGDIGMRIKSDASLTVACRWAHRTHQGWTPSRAVVDGVPALDHILRFAHASATEPLRLYEMSFVVDGGTAFDLRDLLASRYGKPRVLGAPSLPLLVWDNGTSTITICLLPDNQRATLTYMLKPAVPAGKGIDKTLKISQFDEG